MIKIMNRDIYNHSERADEIIMSCNCNNVGIKTGKEYGCVHFEWRSIIEIISEDAIDRIHATLKAFQPTYEKNNQSCQI